MRKRRLSNTPTGRHKLYTGGVAEQQAFLEAPHVVRAPRRPQTAEEVTIQNSINHLEQIGRTDVAQQATFEGQDQHQFMGDNFQLTYRAGELVVKNNVEFQDRDA